MRIQFAFGRTGLELELPAGYRYRVLKARSAKPLANARAAIEGALDGPIGSAPLRDLARGKKSAAISVCDITRPVPNRDILPPLLERLEGAGVPHSGISILIATGTHRGATPAEIEEICGPETASRYTVLNHDGADLSQHADLGRTKSGTPILIDKRFLAAELHVTIGFIEPHLMAGFSGGRKLVAPGLAATEMTKILHSPKFMRDARAVEGSLEENPLQRELMEVAAIARHDFMVDVALARSEREGRREIAEVFAGEPREAHARGCAFVAETMREDLPEPADAVVTTAAGYPLDLTFYQAVKGVTAAAPVVKSGGKILLLSACEEGLGGPEFTRLVEENPSDKVFMDKIARAPVTAEQWQLEKLGLVTARAQVSFYMPGIPRRYASTMWGPLHRTAEEAVQALVDSLPRGANVALIPEGPYVLARLGAASQ